MPDQWLSEWSRGDILAAAAAVLSFAAIVFALWGWTFRAWLTERRLVKEFGADLYLPEEIANATRYYVRPDATSVDLAQEMEEGTNVVATREDLFQAVERFIDKDKDYRHLLLLADAGMGKSSFVLNYYDYNRRKWRKPYKLAVIPLGHKKALEKIRQIPQPNKTILFLDAFDEDPGARQDYRARLNELMEAASEFRRVLITCRTQFFPKDAAIPKAAGMVFGPRPGGAQLTFGRLYLAPFSDEQVDAFLSRRYWFWQFRKKRKAREFARKVPKLTVRPMLLGHLPDLLETEGQFTTSWELYEVLTDRWCAREKGFWEREGDLRKFSEEVAVHFYLDFLRTGADRVPREVVTKIVEDLKVSIPDLDEWKATSRSLLHRDAEGNWKFAHRSIMEFLFLKRFFAGDQRCHCVAWTDQMKKFVLEAVVAYKQSSLGNLAGADLTGVDLAHRFLHGENLAGVNLSGATLAGSFLDSSIFAGADLTGADLTGADLDNTVLRDAKLDRADLTGARLVRADLSGASLVGADLTEANFMKARLVGARLNKADLTEAGFQGANLSGAELIEARIDKTHFWDAILTGADLTGAYISASALREADFSGAILNKIVPMFSDDVPGDAGS